MNLLSLKNLVSLEAVKDVIGPTEKLTATATSKNFSATYF